MRFRIAPAIAQRSYRRPIAKSKRASNVLGVQANTTSYVIVYVLSEPLLESVGGCLIVHRRVSGKNGFNGRIFCQATFQTPVEELATRLPIECFLEKRERFSLGKRPSNEPYPNNSLL